MKQCENCKRNFPDHMVFCPFDGGVLEDKEVDPLVGRLVEGKYRIESKVGEGGMGAVYRAKHVMMDNAVAVKVLHSTLVADKTAVARFQREAQAAARIKHPNAITVTDFGVTEDNIIYIVMELFEGQSLRERLEKKGRLSMEESVDVARQTCAALEAAHRSGVIHRDVKPDNIVIEERPGQGEVVKVLDFGIAKLKDAPSTTGNNDLTRQGVIIGSPHYLSPEQCQSSELDARSDVYSMGVVLYEMLTGEVPFTANTPVAVALKHANEMPRSMRVDHPDIPEGVDKVVLRALSKEPERRQQTAMILAAEFEQAVKTALASRPEKSPEPSAYATKPLDLMPQKDLIDLASGDLKLPEKKPETPSPAPRVPVVPPPILPPRPEPSRSAPPSGDKPAGLGGTPTPGKGISPGPRPKSETTSTTSGHAPVRPVPPPPRAGSSPVVYRSSMLESYDQDGGDTRRRQMMIGVGIGVAVLVLVVVLWLLFFSSNPT